MPTQMPAQEELVEPAPLDWPDVITSSVYVRPEHGHWVAVLPRFSIVGMGDTAAAAFEDMDKAMVAYLRLCEEDGVPFDSVVRPLPLGDRAWMRLSASIVAAVAAVFRPRRRPQSVRAGFSLAHGDHEHDGQRHAPAVC